jgi:hypothetical protein
MASLWQRAVRGVSRRERGIGALAHDIAVVLAVKVGLLVLLWYAFVRGQDVPVDARATAAQLGLTDRVPSAPPNPQGARDGQ